MKKYTTVLFDLDNTLIDFDKDERNGLLKTLKAYGIEPTEETINKYVMINDALWKKFEKGEITTSEIKIERFRGLFKSIGITPPVSIREVSETYAYNLSCGGNLIDGAQQLCISLKESGYMLYAVTNGIEKTQKNRLKRSGLDKILADAFISETIGFHKPTKEYFDHVFSKIAEKDKSKIILVGDSLTSDILGANNAGIDCIWLNLKNKKNISDINPTYEIDNIQKAAEIIFD